MISAGEGEKPSIESRPKPGAPSKYPRRQGAIAAAEHCVATVRPGKQVIGFNETERPWR